MPSTGAASEGGGGSRAAAGAAFPLLGRDGPVPQPQLVPLQAHQELQAQQEEPEPLAVPLAGEGAGAEALQVPGEQTQPAPGVAVPVPLQHGPLLPPRPGARTRARLVPAGPHRHLRAHGEQAQQPGREAEAGGGGEKSRVRAAAENPSTRN